MNKLIINNNQLINFVNDDWQKNIIALATYKTLLKKNEIKENINYEKELIENVKFLNILKEDLKIQRQKPKKLSSLISVNPLERDDWLKIMIVPIVILLFLPICIFLTAPFTALLIPSLLIFPLMNHEIIIFGIKFLINKFIKLKNKKINNENKFLKNKVLKKLLSKNNFKSKKYFYFKKNYLLNIYQKNLNNFDNHKNNKINFDSYSINSMDLQIFQPLTKIIVNQA